MPIFECRTDRTSEFAPASTPLPSPLPLNQGHSVASCSCSCSCSYSLRRSRVRARARARARSGQKRRRSGINSKAVHSALSPRGTSKASTISESCIGTMNHKVGQTCRFALPCGSWSQCTILRWWRLCSFLAGRGPNALLLN